jgi:hypothetical protein
MPNLRYRPNLETALLVVGTLFAQAGEACRDGKTRTLGDMLAYYQLAEEWRQLRPRVVKVRERRTALTTSLN